MTAPDLWRESARAKSRQHSAILSSLDLRLRQAARRTPRMWATLSGCVHESRGEIDSRQGGEIGHTIRPHARPEPGTHHGHDRARKKFEPRTVFDRPPLAPFTRMNFGEFFKTATDNAPYDYQRRLACGADAALKNTKTLEKGAPCQSQLVNVPTGLGKTAAVVMLA